MMFFKCHYYTYDKERICKDSHLIEAPSRERAAAYIRSEHERTGMDVLMQRIYTGDDGVAPVGYRFETQQVWVERGADPGWVRQWFKDTSCQHEPVLQGPQQIAVVPPLCRRCGKPINWSEDTRKYELVDGDTIYQKQG